MPIKKYKKTRKIKKRGGRDPKVVKEQKSVKTEHTKSPLRVGEQYIRLQQPPLQEELINPNNNIINIGQVGRNGLMRLGGRYKHKTEKTVSLDPDKKLQLEAFFRERERERERAQIEENIRERAERHERERQELLDLLNRW